MDAPPQNAVQDDRLLAAAQGGDTEAFWRLAQRYIPYFKAVAAGMLGNQLAGKVDSSDVVQESLAVAFQQMTQFRGDDASQWQGWVLAIVKSQTQKQLRYWHQQKRDVRRQQPLAGSSSGEQQLAADSSGPSQRAARREQTARLLVMIDRLPSDYRQVLYLRNFEDLPYADIAVRMQRSEGAVRVLWARAVQRLRDEWGDES